MITPIKRTKDLMTGNEDLEILYTVKDFPAYLGTTSQKSDLDEHMDMRWAISRESGMVQLAELVPEDVLYKETHVSPVGKTWEKHNIEFADFLDKYMLNGEKIVEIGGGNGILNATYNKKLDNNKYKMWLIVEPSNTEVLPGVTAEYIRRYWDDNILETIGKADILVHAHLMEHIYDLHDFMRTNCDALPVGGKMIFAIPNLKEFVKKKYTQGLCFEHTYLMCDDYAEILLKQYGFKILEKKIYNGVDLYYATEKEAEGVSVIPDYSGLYDENKKIFNEFIEYQKNIVKELNEKIDKEEKRPIYLFGAHVFSQYLIKFGLHTDKIRFVLDNAEIKQNKRLYGTNLETRSPRVLAEEENPIVILKVSQYRDEIANDIIQNINEHTEFWE